MASLLIVKLSSLGDVIHTLPAAQALRAAFPRIHMAWAVDRAHAGVLARQPWLDEVIEHDRRNVRTFVDFIRRLRRRRWDIAVDFQCLMRSGLVTWLSGARRRVGHAPSKEHAHWLYNERVPVGITEQHAAERYYQLAQHLGGKLPGMPLSRPYLAGQPPQAADDNRRLFPLQPSHEDQLQAGAWLAVHGFDATRQRLVLMHPHARREANLWPSAHYAMLARRLLARDDLRVGLIGGAAARDLCDRIAGVVGDRLWRADGQLSLLASAELISRASVLVTGDSGPMHLAAAMGTPLVAMFGPTNPVRSGPYCTNAEVIDKRIACCHCKAKSCPRQLDPPECMQAISVDEVAAAVDRQLTAAETALRRSA